MGPPGPCPARRRTARRRTVHGPGGPMGGPRGPQGYFLFNFYRKSNILKTRMLAAGTFWCGDWNILHSGLSNSLYIALCITI